MTVPEPAYERLLERRDRKRRNDRNTGLTIGLLVIALVGTAIFVGSHARTTPVRQTTPSPVGLPGPISHELIGGLDEPLQPGRYWLSRGDLFVSFDVPAGWRSLGDVAVLGPRRTFVSFWFVDRVSIDPCNWAGASGDPGASVDDLVAALSDQPGVSDAVDATLAGYEGRTIRLQVPNGVSRDADAFKKDCDVVTSRGGSIEHVYIRWWMGDTAFLHWPDQIDRVWILDIQGERLVVAAGLFPDTSQRTKTDIDNIVDSISIT